MLATSKFPSLPKAIGWWPPGLPAALTMIASLAMVGSLEARPEHGQVFKDWTARCEQAPCSSLAHCFIFQNLVLKESGQRLVHMAVGYLAGKNQAAAIVTMPLGISLPAGAAISVDGGDSLDIVIERCDTNGCLGTVTLSAAFLAQLKRGREARIGFHDGARRRIDVPVSLLGFTAGFNSLDP